MRALRRRFVDAEIHLLVAAEYADAARLIPGHDAIIEFDRSSGLSGLLKLRGQLHRAYGLLIDLQNSWRSTFLRTLIFPTIWVAARRYRLRRWLLINLKWDTYRLPRSVAIRYLDAAETLGANDDGAGLDLRVPWDAAQWATHFLIEKKIDGRFVVLCPGARHFTKRWPIERWRSLAVELSATGIEIVVTGMDTEGSSIETVCAGLPTAVPLIESQITRVAAVLEKADAVITNDSGLMHLASGLNRPVVALFGPTVEQFGFFPFRANATILQHQLNCRPCTAFGGRTCPKGHFRCMLNTDVRQVLTAVQQYLAS